MLTHPADLDLAAFIIQTVCHDFRIGFDELESYDRSERTVWPRWISIYLTSKYTQMDRRVIGDIFNRTKSCVRHIITRSMPARLETESHSRAKVFQLESYILAYLRRPSAAPLSINHQLPQPSTPQ